MTLLAHPFSPKLLLKLGQRYQYTHLELLPSMHLIERIMAGQEKFPAFDKNPLFK